MGREHCGRGLLSEVTWIECHNTDTLSPSASHPALSESLPTSFSIFLFSTKETAMFFFHLVSVFHPSDSQFHLANFSFSNVSIIRLWVKRVNEASTCKLYCQQCQLMNSVFLLPKCKKKKNSLQSFISTDALSPVFDLQWSKWTV